MNNAELLNRYYELGTLIMSTSASTLPEHIEMVKQARAERAEIEPKLVYC